MTILTLISSEGHYGAENLLVTLNRTLSRLGCRCIIGVFEDSRFPHDEVAESAEREGLLAVRIPCHGRLDFGAIKQIRRLIVVHEVDILHPHGYKADTYTYLANWPRRVPMVATVHNWPSRLPTMRLYGALDRFVLRRFDRVAVVSDGVTDLLRRWGVATRKLRTIRNAVDVERYRTAYPTLRSDIVEGYQPVVGFVGRLVPSKGGEALLRAAQKVLTLCPSAGFVFVGDGPSRQEWEALARDLGINERVRFLGSRTDMPGVYASLDMVVLPSRVESMPMCVLEAMAAGKPVIATSVGAVPQLITSGRTGLLVQTDDVEALASAISRLVMDRHFAVTLGNQAYERAVQQFSADAMANEYLELYRQALASSAVAAKRLTPNWTAAK